MVDVSYKMFAMIVACKKEDRRETIVDQRNVDIGKAADAVGQTEYVYEELSTKIRSVNLLKFRERAVFPKCETSERLCAKARDFKLMCSMDYNNYLEGTRCFSRVAEGTKGWLKDVSLDVENLQESVPDLRLLCRK